ncbi:MAG: tyrosine-type recombinase/integrase [Caulobacteraceae bacterium]|nr:tyrosine-type recombinase/integrase [Caulobacteraceae bacterium]
MAFEFTPSKSRFKTLVSIPLYPRLRKVLQSIPRRSEFVLTNSRGKGWSDGGFASSWNKLKKKSSASAKHFHDLRGTAATMFLNAGVSIADVAQLMGWSSQPAEHCVSIHQRGYAGGCSCHHDLKRR